MELESPDSRAARREHVVRVAILSFAGGAFALAGVVYNPWLLARLSADGHLEPATASQIRLSEIVFAVAATVLLGVATLSSRRAAKRAPRPFVTKLMLAVVSVGVPLAIAELALRPFWLARELRQATTIFMRDRDLGWRLRPGAVDEWDGVRVRINAKGLRGPEVGYDKPAGVVRIVYLGDSVTFGHGLERDDETYPALVEQRLERDHGLEVETVNGAVGGYSTWQERAWLETDGIRYHPDLVVVGFVLNDVTEPQSLALFGSNERFNHMARTASRWRLEERSSVLYYLRGAIARRLYGADVRGGATRQETLNVQCLADDPGRPSVRQAWASVLEDLDAIVAFCAQRKIAVALVVFPYVFQFDDPEQLSAPQSTLAEFARERHVPILDLLPPLSARLRAEQRAPQEWFLDDDHPSPAGSAVIAAQISDFLVRSRLVSED